MPNKIAFNSWLINTIHMAEIMVTENEETAKELGQKGWLNYFSPSIFPGAEISRSLWIMYRPRECKHSDPYRTLWNLIVEFLSDYKVPVTEWDALITNAYRRWLNFQHRRKNKNKQHWTIL